MHMITPCDFRASEMLTDKYVLTLLIDTAAVKLMSKITKIKMSKNVRNNPSQFTDINCMYSTV